MGEVLGQLLPLALGVAISPVPVIAVILMLFAPKAGGTSAGFLIGWLAGIIAATVLFTWLSSTVGLGGSDGSAAAGWVRIALGVLLLALAAKQWRGRPAPGEEARLPGWMSAIDRFTTGKALALGFALSAVNPKNLAMCAAAGVAVGAGGLTVGSATAVIAVFTVIAGCTVAVPVLAYAFAAERMRGPLDRLKVWLEGDNATVMAVLLLVMGVVLVGKGIGGL